LPAFCRRSPARPVVRRDVNTPGFLYRLPWSPRCCWRAAPASARACPRRQLLRCWEKSQTFADDANWTHAFRLDVELFETSLPLHVKNPALGAFWRFGTSTAAAPSAYELELQYELADPDFETIATVPSIPRPAVRRSGVVDRRTAVSRRAQRGPSAA
jgi:hypothetical protein